MVVAVAEDLLHTIHIYCMYCIYIYGTQVTFRFGGVYIVYHFTSKLADEPSAQQFWGCNHPKDRKKSFCWVPRLKETVTENQMQRIAKIYPLVIEHGHGTSPFQMGFPSQNGNFP